MRFFRFASIALVSGTLLLSSCSSISNSSKGSIIGGALGGVTGSLFGVSGAVTGASIGSAIGSGPSLLIGKKMDKQQAELAKALSNEAVIQPTTDKNGLKALKVTFNEGILFPEGSSTLSASSMASLAKFTDVIKAYSSTNIVVYGYTDNTGTLKEQEKLAKDRANAVLSYLIGQGIPMSGITTQGIPMADYVASNDTPEGRAQNRRVEIYITAREEMIQQANDGTLQ